MGKFKLHKSDKNDQWYWVLVASNGEPIATSEGYTTKQSAKNGIQSVRVTAPFAEIEED